MCSIPSRESEREREREIESCTATESSPDGSIGRYVRARIDFFFRLALKLHIFFDFSPNVSSLQPSGLLSDTCMLFPVGKRLTRLAYRIEMIIKANIERRIQ